MPMTTAEKKALDEKLCHLVAERDERRHNYNDQHPDRQKAVFEVADLQTQIDALEAQKAAG